MSRFVGHSSCKREAMPDARGQSCGREGRERFCRVTDFIRKAANIQCSRRTGGGRERNTQHTLRCTQGTSPPRGPRGLLAQGKLPWTDGAVQLSTGGIAAWVVGGRMMEEGSWRRERRGSPVSFVVVVAKAVLPLHPRHER